MTDDGGTAARSRTVLIAENDEDTREMYAYYPARAGLASDSRGERIGCTCGRGSQRPDVIVLDMALHAVDGWELARRLRAHTATAAVPIVALTGHVFPTDRARSLAAGCDRFLAKPCRPDDLHDELQALLASGPAVAL